MTTRKEFISGRAKPFLAESGPMAVFASRKRERRSLRALASSNGHFYRGRGRRGRGSQMTRSLDLSRGWPIPYDPTQRTYQRPSQAIFSQKRPDGDFIKASWLPGSPREGPSERWPAPTAVSSRPEAQERVLPSAGRPLAVFINAEAAKGPAP